MLFNFKSSILQFSHGYIFGGLSLKQSAMVSRLELFTIIFILTWIGPFCVRMYNYICNCDAPLWATAIHHYGISLLGLGNAIVWSKSKNFHSPIDSYKQMYKNQEQYQQQQFVDQFTKSVSNI